MGTITMIPAKRRIGSRVVQDEVPKTRVAAYCRVSTDTDEQATSYEAQVEHYTEYIAFPEPTPKSGRSLTGL